MSQLAAMKAGMVPNNMIEHPERDGMAIETVKWTNDHWKGRRKDNDEWEKVADFAAAWGSGNYAEVDRWCTVHYKVCLG
jgi:hypothetical protein